MKRLLIIATLAAAANAFAGANLDVKMYSTSNSSNTLSNSTLSTGPGAFVPNRVRVNIDGKVNDNWTWKIQLDPAMTSFTPTATAPDKSVTGLVNYMQIETKLSDKFSVALGKLAVPKTNGWEGVFGTTDTYVTSLSYINTKRFYGVQGTYAISDKHVVDAFVFNNEVGGTWASDAKSPAGKFGGSYSLSYVGWLTDSMGIAAGWTTINGTTHTTDRDVFNTYAVAGFEWKNDSMLASIDYNQVNVANSDTMGGLIKDRKMTEIVGTFRYKMGKWVLPIKIASASGNAIVDGALASSTSAYGASYSYGAAGSLTQTKEASDTSMNASIAAEYMPDGNPKYYWYAAYQMRTTTVDSGAYTLLPSSNNTINDNNVFVGVRFVGDMTANK